MSDHYDVLIIGGGLAGLTLALQLKRERPSVNVGVLERNRHPAPEAAFKVGEATSEGGAHYFSEVVGMRDHLEERQIRKMGLRFFASEGDNRSLVRRPETGPRDFLWFKSYQLDRGRLENELALRARRSGVDVVEGAKVSGFDLDPDSAHRVSFSTGEHARCAHARWLVDASGRRSLVKRALGLGQPVEHEPNASWFRIEPMMRIDDWAAEELECGLVTPEERRAWSGRVPNGDRWRSTNHLLGKGYWIWLIPLASDSISIGLVSDPRFVPFDEVNNFEKLLGWLHRHEPQLAEHVQVSAGGLQDFHAWRHLAFGSRQVFSADRWALTGDAGVFLDPLYSPGSDFIAFANTCITKLVLADLDGAPGIGPLAEAYDEQYRRVFANALPTWEDRYPIMGNPLVWQAKVAWDTLVYFMVIGPSFVSGTVADLDFVRAHRAATDRFTEVGHRMQRAFQDWAARGGGGPAVPFLDMSNDILYRLNAEMGQTEDPARLAERFERNLAALATVGTELAADMEQGKALDPRSFAPKVAAALEESTVTDAWRSFAGEDDGGLLPPSMRAEVVRESR